MAKIYVNGDAQNVNLPLNVSELIKQLHQAVAGRESRDGQRAGERGVC